MSEIALRKNANS